MMNCGAEALIRAQFPARIVICCGVGTRLLVQTKARSRQNAELPDAVAKHMVLGIRWGEGI